MPCPKFVDFTRECVNEIEVIPANTLDLCETEKHKKCPFYLILSGDKNVCENIRKCPAFKKFEMGDFKKFMEMSEKWCVSKNHVACKRYLMKKSGKDVPITLHPDGHTVAEWA
jgi:hypothetical protein